MDEVAVLVVYNQNVGVVGDGELDEASGEIGEDLAGVRGEVGKEEVEFVVGGFLVGGCGCVVCGVGGVGFIDDGVRERGVAVAWWLAGGVLVGTCLV